MQCACAMLSSVACPTPQYLSTLSHKRYDIRKMLLITKTCVLIFFTTSVWNNFHVKKNSAKYVKKYILAIMYSTRYSCQSVMKLRLSRQICEKYADINFYENSSSRSRVVSCGRMAMRKLLGAFRNIANAAKNGTWQWWSHYHWRRPHSAVSAEELLLLSTSV